MEFPSLLLFLTCETDDGVNSVTTHKKTQKFTLPIYLALFGKHSPLKVLLSQMPPLQVNFFHFRRGTNLWHLESKHSCAKEGHWAPSLEGLVIGSVIIYAWIAPSWPAQSIYTKFTRPISKNSKSTDCWAVEVRLIEIGFWEWVGGIEHGEFKVSLVYWILAFLSYTV